MIRTERLCLKEHTNDNLKKLYKWFNDEELAYYNDNEPYEQQDLSAIKKYLENRLLLCGFKDNKDIIHLGIHKKEGDLIGYCMIAHIDRFNKKCKIGLTLGEKKEWGKGYGKEVIKALLDYCFSEIKMNRVEVEIYSINKRSIKLFEEFGFKKEGVLRKSVLKNEKYVDEYIYGLLKNEWEQCK